MKKIIKINLINIGCLLFLELIFNLLMFDNFVSTKIIGASIYILFTSFIITLLTTIFNEKINKIFNYLIYFIICLIYSFQFVFKSSMQTFFSLSLFKLTDQAVGFLGKVFDIIFTNLYGIIILFIPFIMFIVFRKKINYKIEKNKIYSLIYIILIILSFGSYKLYLKSNKEESLSVYDLYYNIDNISLSIQKLGVLPTMGLDIRRTIFGFEENIIYTNSEINTNGTEISICEKNTLDLEIDSNIDSELKYYIENNSGTYKNEYSGIFEGKNLIFIVAESYSEIAVDKDLTPTLYKLTNNGFVFNNFYVPYYLSTIGGEFQSLTGLYPNTDTLGTWRSGNNTFNFGLSNVFEEKGYSTYAYHNHDGYFQNRYKYLKSLGFDNFKACNMDLDINCDLWPESDIEMIEDTYEDYINSNEPFMAYYMTVSGHMDYNFDNNSIASKNKKMVENLPYNESIKAYLATQIELDRALEILITKLEENNKLDDTIIVMLADHYPYALSLEEINKLSDYERDSLFEINHNSLVIWNNKIDKIEIDKVGMPIDVLPTIYNLFGIDYDSRLFAGNDLLSNSEGLVILENRSWITDRGKYNSINSSFSGVEDKEYVDYINNIVQNKIVFSKNMLLEDGYKYIKQKNN